MKNFPHPVSNVSKLFQALQIASELIDANTPLTDYIYGEILLRRGFRSFRDANLTIDQFLIDQRAKKPPFRSYETTARNVKEFFELLDFLTIYPDKTAKLNSSAKQLLRTKSETIRKELWKNALSQMTIEVDDGDIIHPYRVLLKMVKTFPGINTFKLMLALEAKSDSAEEFERIADLSSKTKDEIIEAIGTTINNANNATKILVSLAEQLGDIEKHENKVYALGQLVITEDEITTEEQLTRQTKADFRKTNSESIAKDPILNAVASVNIDLSEAIRIRQRRLAEHQELVRQLALLNESDGFGLYDGKFDCLATKNNSAVLYEVKTITESSADEEKQTVKGVGQLKFYKHSIVSRQMKITDVKEVLVFSRKPSDEIVGFCTVENISVVWKDEDAFQIFNTQNGNIELFNPDHLV